MITLSSEFRRPRGDVDVGDGRHELTTHCRWVEIRALLDLVTRHLFWLDDDSSVKLALVYVGTYDQLVVSYAASNFSVAGTVQVLSYAHTRRDTHAAVVSVR